MCAYGKILASPTWLMGVVMQVAVDLPRFYNPVTNLLAPPPAVLRAPKPGKVGPPL